MITDYVLKDDVWSPVLFWNPLTFIVWTAQKLFPIYPKFCHEALRCSPIGLTQSYIMTSLSQSAADWFFLHQQPMSLLLNIQIHG